MSNALNRPEKDFFGYRAISYTDPATKQPSEEPLVIFQTAKLEEFAATRDEVMTLYDRAVEAAPRALPKGYLLVLQNALVQAWREAGHEDLPARNFNEAARIICETGFAAPAPRPAGA